MQNLDTWESRIEAVDSPAFLSLGTDGERRRKELSLQSASTVLPGPATGLSVTSAGRKASEGVSLLLLSLPAACLTCSQPTSDPGFWIQRPDLLTLEPVGS